MPVDAAVSVQEMMAITLSRQLDDEEVGILGTRSEIAYAACRLAQYRHAPGLWWMSGPSGVVNANAASIMPIASDELLNDAESLLDLTDNVDIIDWSQRTFDFAVLGGMQVDQFGNLNTVVVGDWAHPKVRGPGAIGASVLAAHARRFFIVMTHHAPSSFVPEVDFISAMGFGRDGVGRRDHGLPGAGPELLISPLGTFDFCPTTRRMRVKQLAPGIDMETVQARTGFELLEPSDNSSVTVVPSPGEIRTLREMVDSHHALSESETRP